MDKQVSLVELVQSSLETVDKQVRQVRDKSNCVEHACKLPVRKSHLPLSRIKGLKQSVFRLQGTASHHIDYR